MKNAEEIVQTIEVIHKERKHFLAKIGRLIKQTKSAIINLLIKKATQEIPEEIEKTVLMGQVGLQAVAENIRNQDLIDETIFKAKLVMLKNQNLSEQTAKMIWMEKMVSLAGIDYLNKKFNLKKMQKLER